MSETNSVVAAYGTHEGAGPVLGAGPLVAWIIGVLEGALAVGGVSAIPAGLIGMGIPKDSVIEYDAVLKTAKYPLMVNGTAAEVDKARATLESTRRVNTAMHFCKHKTGR